MSFLPSPYPAGTFVNRPVSPVTGQIYLATDLGSSGLYIWYNGSKWLPLSGSAYLLIDNAAHTAAGNASETNYFTITIPANLVSSTGIVEVFAQGKYAGTNGVKTAIWRISSTSGDTSTGTIIVNTNNGGTASSLSASFFKPVFITGASAQLSTPSGINAYGGGNSTSGLITPGIATTNAWYINLNMTGNAADTIGYQGITVKWVEY